MRFIDRERIEVRLNFSDRVVQRGIPAILRASRDEAILGRAGGSYVAQDSKGERRQRGQVTRKRRNNESSQCHAGTIRAMPKSEKRFLPQVGRFIAGRLARPAMPIDQVATPQRA